MHFYNQLQVVGIIIVIILYFILPEQKQEGFQGESESGVEPGLDNQNPYQVSFPTLNEIQSVIGSKEYFKLFKDLDFKVRDCPPVISYCQKKYREAVLQPTPKEQEKFTLFYHDLIESIPKELQPKLLRSEIKIAKTFDIESKFPHTHQDIIFFNQSYFKKLENYQKGNLKTHSLAASTLIHEITHLKQRDHPQKYDALYREWGFQPISYQYLTCNFPHHILNRIRLNPDELPHYRFWVWNGKVLPLVLYESSKARSVSEVVYIGLDWTKPFNKVKAEYDYLDRFKDFGQYFGIRNNHYHPVEIHAEYQAMQYLEILNQLESKKSEGYQLYKKSNIA